MNVSARPAPVFNATSLSFSTKKERRTPRLVPPPKPCIKSCPVTRLTGTPRLLHHDSPLPVSFSEQSSSFIASSKVYRPHLDDSFFKQCFEVEAKLGAGSFGEVFRVRSREDGKVYACKRTIIRFRGDGDRKRKFAEVAKHQLLPPHPNCIQFYKAWEEHQHLYILTEACEQSLAAIADNNPTPLTEDVIWNYTLDLLQALEHLHKHSLVHMDIKPENIFLSSDGTCKLGDFGLMLDMNKDNLSEAIEGDPRYMSKECLSSHFGPAADMFSLGVSLLELALDLELPASGLTWLALRNGELPKPALSLSRQMQTLIKGLLNPDPEQRLTATQCLSMSVFVQLKRRRICGAVMNTVTSVAQSTAATALRYTCLFVAPLYNNTIVSSMFMKYKAMMMPSSNTQLCTPSRPCGTTSPHTSSSTPRPQILAPSLIDQGSPTVLRRRCPDPSDSNTQHPPTFVCSGPLKYSDSDQLDNKTEADSSTHSRPLPHILTSSRAHSTPRCASTPSSTNMSAVSSSRHELSSDSDTLDNDISVLSAVHDTPTHFSLVNNIFKDNLNLNGDHSRDLNVENHILSFSRPQNSTSNGPSFIPPTPQSSRRTRPCATSSVQRKRLFGPGPSSSAPSNENKSSRLLMRNVLGNRKHLQFNDPTSGSNGSTPLKQHNGQGVTSVSSSIKKVRFPQPDLALTNESNLDVHDLSGPSKNLLDMFSSASDDES